MKLFSPTMQSGERVVRMGRERNGKMDKGGIKRPTRRGLKFSRQGLPKIYPPNAPKISDEMRAFFAKKD